MFEGVAGSYGFAGPCEACDEVSQNLIEGVLCPQCHGMKIVAEVAGALYLWRERERTGKRMSELQGAEQ